MKVANWLVHLMFFSFIFFLWACAENGDGSGTVTNKLISDEETSTVKDATITESSDTVVLDSSISTPAASLVIKVVGDALPTSGLTARVLGGGNDCGEYKLSSGFAQSSTEVQLDAPIDCLTSSITNASEIQFSQSLQDVVVVALQNEGEAKEFDILASGTIGTPPAGSMDRTLRSIPTGRNFTSSGNDDVIDLADVIYLFAYFQGTRDTVENLTAAGQALLPSITVPVTILPTPIFDNFTASETDKVVDWVDIVYLFAYFQGTTNSLADLEVAAKALVPSIAVSPTAMPQPTGFETTTLATPLSNADAGSLVIRIVGTGLPTTGWKAAILGGSNDCGGYKQASSFPHSSTEIMLDAPIDCLYSSLANISQITFNYELNGATVTLQENQGGGTYRTLGSTVSTDIASPSVASISANTSTTTNPAITLTISGTDNESLAAYYLSENSSTPSVTDPEWVIITPDSSLASSNFSADVSFTLSAESAVGSYVKTVYAWLKDGADNISSPASTSITLVVEDSTPSTVPVNQAAAVAFIDTDTDAGEIAGDVVITKASDESDITDYVLYWGSSSSTKLTEIATTSKRGANITYSFANNTAIPANASHLLVYTKNNVGENGSPGNAYVEITDHVLQTNLKIATGVRHNCAVLSDGSIKCWGKGWYGRLGNGSNSDSNTPVSVSGINNAVQVSVGYAHSCAVLNDGSVKCWGRGRDGRLGNGSSADSNTPVLVTGITNAMQVAVGYEHTCALLSDKSIKCWGNGNAGQLGNGRNRKYSTPVTVSGITTAVQVSAGNDHVCAVLDDATVWCWGRSSYIRLGKQRSNNSNIPLIVDLPAAVEVSAGGFHTCARLADGTLKCWGHGISGQLGDGNRRMYSQPVSVSSISNAVEVSAGGFHTCARLADGTLKCWGNGWYGQLGTGSFSSSTTPASVSGISNAVGVSAGGLHSCAVKGGTAIDCWGRGKYGLLGTGNTSHSNVPVSVVGL